MRSLALVVMVVPLSACAATDVSTTTTTSAEVGPARPVGMDEAIRAITRAQCARVQACGAPASFGLYYNQDYCAANVVPETRDDLSDACESIDPARLAACLDAVRREPCPTLAETNRAPEPCRARVLCGGR